MEWEFIRNRRVSGVESVMGKLRYYHCKAQERHRVFIRMLGIYAFMSCVEYEKLKG